MRKNNKHGFTLAELLIVVAIIAVLVAIAIPVFTAQLEKSREATDLANIRSAYAEVSAASLTDPDNDHTATVPVKQTQTGWQTTGAKLGNLDINDTNFPVSPLPANYTVKYTHVNGGPGTITVNDHAIGGNFLVS